MYGISKLANESDDSKKDLLALTGLGAVGAGAKALNSAIPKLDGMERLYHGTSKENARGIKELGILASRAGEGEATRNANLEQRIGKDKVDGKVYLTRVKDVAKNAGLQQAGWKPNGFNLPTKEHRSNMEVIKAKIPYRDFQTEALKQAPNPELRGMGTKEWVEAIKKDMLKDMLLPPPTPLLENAYRQLDAPNTRTIEGNVDPKYILGSKEYKGQTLKGLADYVKHNPKRFAGGLGLAGAGAAGVGTGAHLLYKRTQME